MSVREKVEIEGSGGMSAILREQLVANHLKIRILELKFGAIIFLE